MEAGADLDRGRKAAPNRDLSQCGSGNAGQELQNCALACSVVSNDAQRFPFSTSKLTSRSAHTSLGLFPKKPNFGQEKLCFRGVPVWMK